MEKIFRTLLFSGGASRCAEKAIKKQKIFPLLTATLLLWRHCFFLYARMRTCFMSYLSNGAKQFYMDRHNIMYKQLPRRMRKSFLKWKKCTFSDVRWKATKKERKWLHESHVESIKIIKLMMWTNRKYFSCLSLVPILFFPSAISFFVCYCSDVDIFLFPLFAFFMLFCSGCFNIILIMQSFQFSGIN